MITAVVFDLDNVLVDWDSRYLYRRLFAGDEVAMERFLPEVCTPEWNAQQDLGRSFVEAENKLIARHPEKAEFICAWRLHYDATMKGATAKPTTETSRRSGSPAADSAAHRSSVSMKPR
jgi:2-haloacid dehalogenase